jgi:hypothetical protein
MLATHNSGTGEKGYGWWSFLYAPFAKCQSKTLVEQFREGVRLFDIRVRKRGDKWVFAHGLWESEDAVGYALSDLNLVAFKTGAKAMLMVTYEGECKDKVGFMAEVSSLDCYSWLEIVDVSVKKPKWRTLARYNDVSYNQCFRVLDFSTWHTLVTIPWIWAKVKSMTKKPSHNVFNMYDFI